jgi:hypothetical protein
VLLDGAESDGALLGGIVTATALLAFQPLQPALLQACAWYV